MRKLSVEHELQKGPLDVGASAEIVGAPAPGSHGVPGPFLSGLDPLT